MRTAKTLIRLGRCPGWSQSSLGAHVILLVLSCHGSNMHCKYSDNHFYRILSNRYIHNELFVSKNSWENFTAVLCSFQFQEYKNLSWLVWTEKSVMRVTVLHHKTYWVMLDIDPKGQTFLYTPKQPWTFLFLAYQFFPNIISFVCNVHLLLGMLKLMFESSNRRKSSDTWPYPSGFDVKTFSLQEVLCNLWITVWSPQHVYPAHGLDKSV